MTLEERIRSCEVCRLRKHTEIDWIVCSLTDKLPEFEKQCPDFELDAYEAQSRREFSQESKVAIGDAVHHRNDEKLMAGGFLIGCLLILVSIALGVFQLQSIGTLGAKPIMLFVIGGAAITRDVFRKHL